MSLGLSEPVSSGANSWLHPEESQSHTIKSAVVLVIVWASLDRDENVSSLPALNQHSGTDGL